MHHPRSTTDVIRFRLAAFLLIANFLVAMVAAGLMFRSVLVFDHQLTVIGLGYLAVALIMLVVQWIVASGASCPLCRTPVLAPKLCTKHRHARSLFGSHRLRVATSILFTNHFRCPYCNEPTGMEVRGRIDHSRV